MKKHLPTIAVLTTSGSFGILLAMGLGFGIFWKTLEPIKFMEVFGAEFPYFILPTVMMLLPALISTIWLVVIHKQQKEIRKPWLYAMAGMITAFMITNVYHLPTNLGFMGLEYTAEEAASRLNIWLILHWVRSAAVFCSCTICHQSISPYNHQINRPTKSKS